MVWVMAAVAAVSVASQLFGSSKRKKAAKRQAAAARHRSVARREQLRLEKLKLQRQRRGISREARLARGAALQAGASSGASIQSSGIAGGIGGAESVAAASLGFLGEAEKGADVIAFNEEQAANFDLSAAQNLGAANTIQSIGSSAASILSKIVLQ